MSAQPLSLGSDDDHSGKPWCMQYMEQAGLATNMCEACMPGSRGRNCWELDMSLCCQHPRTDCERCHVYLSHLKNSSRAVQVTIALDPGHQISGNIHIPTDAHVCDAVNRTDRDFLPVTGLSGDPRVPEGDFMLVNTSTIRYLMPHEALSGGGPPAPDGEARPVWVTMALAEGYQISGNIHVPSDARVSDAVNSIDLAFLPVTGLGNDPRLAGGDYLLVNTRAIRYLIPHRKPAGNRRDVSGW